MDLVAHYDLKLYYMNIKMGFLNENFDEKIYIEQPEGFYKKGKRAFGLQT